MFRVRGLGGQGCGASATYVTSKNVSISQRRSEGMFLFVCCCDSHSVQTQQNAWHSLKKKTESMAQIWSECIVFLFILLWFALCADTKEHISLNISSALEWHSVLCIFCSPSPGLCIRRPLVLKASWLVACFFELVILCWRWHRPWMDGLKIARN